MNRKHLRLGGIALLAPLMASCAQQNARVVGPPIPSPLSVREAAELAQGQVAAGGRLEHIDCLDDGQLFAVDAPANGGSGPVRESRLLIVHNDGTILEWPGR